MSVAQPNTQSRPRDPFSNRPNWPRHAWCCLAPSCSYVQRVFASDGAPECPTHGTALVKLLVAPVNVPPPGGTLVPNNSKEKL
jgi:hypothetical protein